MNSVFLKEVSLSEKLYFIAMGGEIPAVFRDLGFPYVFSDGRGTLGHFVP